MRNYRHEHELENSKKDRIEVKLLKEDSKRFKEKLQSEGKNASEFLREQVLKYINE